MGVLAIDLSDRALAVAQDGRVLGVRPSVVFEGSTEAHAEGQPGTPAWHALRRSPTAVSTRHLAQVLKGERAPRAGALLAAELAWRLREAGEQGALYSDSHSALWLAAPALANPQGLSALLGLTRSLGLTVAGFVDAATAQVAALALERPALVLELGLHHLAATLVERGGESYSARRVVAGAAGGWLALLAQLAELVGRTLVKQTRFDPLHEASSEQLLYDGLPALVAEALTAGSATFVSPQAAAQNSFSEGASVVISRDALAQAAQGLRREVMRLVHGLRPAGRPLCLLAPQDLLSVPGVAQDLESLSGCELISVPPGFAALAVTALALPPASSADPVRLLRRLPGCEPPLAAEAMTRLDLGGRRASAPPPSHVLWEGEAYPLNGLDSQLSPSVALVVGCDPGAGDVRAVLRLGAGLAGISRRHCSFLAVGGEIVLLDHSRYGTFVNGERVAERARVHAGDRIRLGDPGVELALIAVPAPVTQVAV